MKFTILSHAGMLVESNGISLMTDPWILGSCYWRSWWNYPKPAAFASRLEKLNFIYITHMHWDHFHGPSLRKLPKDATVLVPKTHFRRMVKDLKDCDRERVIELPHGEPLQLAPGLVVTSYQYGLATDSALMISDGETVLADLNDCKISGLPLRQVLSRYPKVDFMFRSHSSASPFPHCIRTEDASDSTYAEVDRYTGEFIAMAELVQPKHAIPFASNHCFLHRETVTYNATVQTPLDVKAKFDDAPRGRTQCTIMVPGDSWDSEKGFHLQQQDYFENREHYLAEYQREMEPVLQKQYRLEDGVELSFRAFQKYFQKFMGAVPGILRMVSRPVVVFSFLNIPDRHWVVDFKRNAVEEVKGLPPEHAFRITVHPFVMQQCVQKRLFATFTASKRLTVEVKRGHMKDLMVFLQLLDMYEYEFFPLFQQATSMRFMGVWLRRWREVVQMTGMVAHAVFSRLRHDDGLRTFVPKVE